MGRASGWGQDWGSRVPGALSLGGLDVNHGSTKRQQRDTSDAKARSDLRPESMPRGPGSHQRGWSCPQNCRAAGPTKCAHPSQNVTEREPSGQLVAMGVRLTVGAQHQRAEKLSQGTQDRAVVQSTRALSLSPLLQPLRGQFVSDSGVILTSMWPQDSLDSHGKRRLGYTVVYPTAHSPAWPPRSCLPGSNCLLATE